MRAMSVKGLLYRLVRAVESVSSSVDMLWQRQQEETSAADRRIQSLANAIDRLSLAGYRWASRSSGDAGLVRSHRGDWLLVEHSAMAGHLLTLQEALASGVPLTLVYLPDVKDRWKFFQDRTTALRHAGVEEPA